MPHAFETAPTGRARCRGCGKSIAKGELRFGERLPNAFGEGEMTLWFHPLCAVYKRPEPLLEALDAADAAVPEPDALRRLARTGLAHRRLPRLDGAERAPSGRARCRACREMIEKDGWRIRLVFYQEGRFEPGGFIHLGCARTYFETSDLEDRIRQFSTITEEDLAGIRLALAADPDAGDAGHARPA